VGDTPSHPDVPDPVRQLLVEHVDSFEKLELLVLCGTRPDTGWTASSAAAELRLPVAVVEPALDELVASGILVREGTDHRLCGPGDAVGGPARALCRLYRDDRVVILNLLATQALQRIKSSAARTFAEAFRLKPRRGKGEDDA
jgi:hypothetical protein